MELYVVRHAIAEEAAPDQDDPSRRLTPDGHRKLKKAVQGLRDLRIRFDRILTSPWARARETAEALSPLCDDAPIESELLTRSPCAELLAQIAEVTSAAKRGTAVVGHEPWLGELVSLLAFGDTRFGDSLTIKKSGLVWLDGTAVPGGMMIRAIVPPKFLRAIH
jgi:phosphohistidine phosphatase